MSSEQSVITEIRMEKILLRRIPRPLSVIMAAAVVVGMLLPAVEARASGGAPDTPVPTCSNGFVPSDIWTYCGLEHTGGNSTIAFIQSLHIQNADIHHNFHLQEWDWAGGTGWKDSYNWHLYFDGEVDNGMYGPTYNFSVWDNIVGNPRHTIPISTGQCPFSSGNIYMCAKTASDNFIDYFYLGNVPTLWPDLRTALNTKSSGRTGTLPNAFCNVVHQKHIDPNYNWAADCTPQ